MLTRGAGRRREMAVRAALGASRARLVRIALVESLLIAFGGTLMGVFFASEVVPRLAQLVPQSIAGWAEPLIDVRLILLASCLSTAAAAIFGCLPAMTTTRVDLAAALKQGARGAIQGSDRLRRVFGNGGSGPHGRARRRRRPDVSNFTETVSRRTWLSAARRTDGTDGARIINLGCGTAGMLISFESLAFRKNFR